MRFQSGRSEADRSEAQELENDSAGISGHLVKQRTGNEESVGAQSSIDPESHDTAQQNRITRLQVPRRHGRVKQKCHFGPGGKKQCNQESTMTNEAIRQSNADAEDLEWLLREIDKVREQTHTTDQSPQPAHHESGEQRSG